MKSDDEFSPCLRVTCLPLWVLLVAWASIGLLGDLPISALDCFPAGADVIEGPNNNLCYCEGSDVKCFAGEAATIPAAARDGWEYPECEVAYKGPHWDGTSCNNDLVVVSWRYPAIESRSVFVARWALDLIKLPIGLPFYVWCLSLLCLIKFPESQKTKEAPLKSLVMFKGPNQVAITAFPRALWLGGSRYPIAAQSLDAGTIINDDLDLGFAVKSDQVQYPKHKTPLPPLLDYVPVFPLIARKTFDVLDYEPGFLHRFEAWFGHSLIDRTSLIRNEVQVTLLDPIPSYDRKFSMRLDSVIEDSVDNIIKEAEMHSSDEIMVLWSGGIDSTTALVALKKRFEKSPGSITSNLVILYTSRSQTEYPWFWKNHVEKYPEHSHGTAQLPGPKILRRNVSTLIRDGDFSAVLKMTGSGDEKGSILVTGEHGDQIFGSSLMKLAFGGDKLPSGKRNHLKNNLGTNWQDVIPAMLQDHGAVQSGQAFEMWITPQLMSAPMPIVSVFDFLWWVNFSMAWQHTSMRLFQAWPAQFSSKTFKPNQGDPDQSRAAETQSVEMDEPLSIPPWMFRRVSHFFRTTNWQQWSYHNHSGKFPDQRDWKTFKSPLKDYIYSYTHDLDYAQSKEQETSAAFPYGANLGIAGDGSVIRFGKHNICLDLMTAKYEDKLEQLCQPLRPEDVSDYGPKGPTSWWLTNGPHGKELDNDFGSASVLSRF